MTRHTLTFDDDGNLIGAVGMALGSVDTNGHGTILGVVPPPTDVWDDDMDKPIPLRVTLPTPAGATLADTLTEQIAWSRRTFGPGPRTGGLTAHIRSELDEIAADPTDVTEWIDVAILALDGAWRAAVEWTDTADPAAPPRLHSIRDRAAFVAANYTRKLAANYNRTWPDWRQASQDQPIEHDRSTQA